MGYEIPSRQKAPTALLVKMYVEDKMSTREIAKVCGMCHASVKERLHKAGVWMRQGREATGIASLAGQHFANLHVVREVVTDNKSHIKYECRCVCGKITIVNRSCLITGHTQSCGCKRIEAAQKRALAKYYEGVPFLFFNRLLAGAAVRGWKVEISIEDIWDLYVKQDGKCALSGVSIGWEKNGRWGKWSASVDRIDSSKDYTIDNVHLVHKNINLMKQGFTKEEFILFCRLVTEHTSEVQIVVSQSDGEV